jgi:hypothetical protein
MAARKKNAKKAPAKPTKAAGKKTSRAAAPSKKKAASRKQAPAKKPAPRAARPKAAPAAQPAAKPVAVPALPAPRPPAPPATGAVGADEVLLGHVMALRPRIHVGFRPSAFGDAKRALADRRFATIQDAARAVAEKAIEISNESSPRSPFDRR